MLKVNPFRKTVAPRRDLWTLFDTSNAEGSTLAEYLQIVLDRSAEWLQASGASIFLVSDSPDTFELAATAGHESSAPADAKIVKGIGIAGSAIEARRPIRLDDPASHPALVGASLKRNRKWGSSLVVPLLTPDGECIGVLNLSRKLDEPRFSDSDLRSAKTFGGHIALAVSNRRLLSRLKETVAEATQIHETLDTILSSIAVGIVVVDVAGVVTHVNPEARALIGNVETGVDFGRQIESFEPWLQKPLTSIVNAGLKGERASEVANDSPGPLAYALTAAPLPGGGATIGVQDTSDYEQALREMSRVRRLAEIGQMTAAIAHEIRNPLWAMRGAAQVIQTDPGVAVEFGRIIEDEVIKLNELCNGFLDFARPLELNLRSVKLGEIVGEIVDRHQPLFHQRKVRLLFETGFRDEWVEADPLRLEQVVRNLLMNALDASQPGETVYVRCKGGSIIVQDSGCGMEQDSLEKLFTPFFTTKANGTGLGLSTIRKVVDAHGGDIAVESAPGRGTTFTVSFRGKAA